MNFVMQKDDSLSHHGIRGQKWGVRRFQNEDGSLTAAGKKRYIDSEYESNLAYNSQKNEYPNGKEEAGRAKAMTISEEDTARYDKIFNDARVDLDDPRFPYEAMGPSNDRWVSKEYQAELDYNSKKNSFGHSDELWHYGIIGMKWGVRRYQNENGKLTPEGRERYKQDVQQYKADKNKAFTTSKKATIAGYAAEIGQRRADKANAKLDKALESGNEKRIAKASKKADIAKLASDALWEEYNSLAKQGEEHVAELINRYGEEHVKGLKYRETAKGKVIDDDSSEIPVAAVAAGASAISVALMATGATPIGVIMVPRSNKSRGIELANRATGEARKAYRDRELESARSQSPSTKPAKSNSDSNWSYTKEERAAAKTKANEKDVWNLEFLERVQNKTYADGTSKDPKKKKRMMQEYDAFLKDPVNYRPPDGDEE